jgi:hypothetical protein
MQYRGIITWKKAGSLCSLAYVLSEKSLTN